MQNKDQLRKKFLKIRKNNYFEVQSNFFYPLVKFLNKIHKVKNLYLSLYYPANYEVNILKLLEHNKLKNIKPLLPVVLKDKKMRFYKWNYKDVLLVNKFGILEPRINSPHNIPQVMLVPLLAYNKEKFRLGYGKGYYDIFLSKYLKKNKNITTIGIGFSFQKCNNLPTLKHDIKMKYILTEKGLN